MPVPGPWPARAERLLTQSDSEHLPISVPAAEGAARAGCGHGVRASRSHARLGLGGYDRDRGLPLSIGSTIAFGLCPADRRFRRHSADSDFLPFVGGAAGPQSGSESLRLVKLDHYSKAYSAIPDTVYRSYRKAELICQLNPVIQSSGSLQALAN